MLYLGEGKLNKDDPPFPVLSPVQTGLHQVQHLIHHLRVLVTKFLLELLSFLSKAKMTQKPYVLCNDIQTLH